MADNTPKNAYHNCSLNEIFDYFRKTLERDYDFVFASSGKYQFVSEFDQKVVCLTESDNPQKKKSIKPRGMYCIFSNLNPETNEYWPVLKGQRFGIAQQEISIVFADYYKNEIKPSRDSNPNYQPPNKEEVERQIQEHQEKKERYRIQQEKEAQAALIAVRLEWKRASRVIDDSYLNRQTGQIESVKRDIRKMPYMVEKNLEPYGTKLMRKDNFTEAEVIEFIKTQFPELTNTQEELNETVENVMLYQKHYINHEPEIEGDKKKGFDLRKGRAIILAPLINDENQIINLQKISHHRQKKRNKDTGLYEEKLFKSKFFFDKLKSQNGFLPIHSNPDIGYEKFNPNAKNYFLTEGWATAVSKRKAFNAALELNLLSSEITLENSQVIATYSKANLSLIAELIHEKNPTANIFIGYDNDAGQTLEGGANPGLQEACHNFSLSGILGKPKHLRTRATLPPVFKNNLDASDWDDARQYLGVERLAQELAKEVNSALIRIANQEPEVAHVIGRYNRQREAFAQKNIGKDYQANYGIIIAQADEKYLDLEASRERSKAHIEEYNKKLQDRQIKNSGAFNRSVVVKEKPKYTPPSFDNMFKKSSTAVAANTPAQQPVNASEAKAQGKNTAVKNYQELLDEMNISAIQNDVLKVVATADGHDKIYDGSLEFSKPSTVDNPTPLPSEMESMQKDKLQIDVSNDLAKPTVKLPSVDITSIPEQDLQKGIDHQSYAKSALFTAFWLHAAEMFKAKEMIKAAELATKPVNSTAAETKLTEAQANITRSEPELFVISASDGEYRQSLMNILNELEKKHPEWENLKQFRENLTTKTIAFDQANLDTFKIKNSVVHLIVSNLSNNNNLNKIQEKLTEFLSKSNNLALDREQKFILVDDLQKTLKNMATQMKEPPIFQRLNDFFERFEDRINDLVRGEGLKMYGIDEQKVMRPQTPGQSLDM